MLPSEHRLTAEFGVARPTVVRALRTLRADGWIQTQQGKGSFVRGRPALAGAERTRPAHGVLELPEAELAGELVQAGVKLAPPHIATLLGLERGARAFVRQRLLSEDGEPVELASAWLPLELAAGTDLASPDLLGESIRHHLQVRKKIRLDYASEQITARHPVGDEALLLKVASDAPVLNVVVTAFDATGRPVQVSDLVLPGQRHELRDAYPLT
jgi:GntR family transcriptional regulator